MHTYETVFITLPTLTEEDEKSVVDTFARIITDGGGTIHANDRMGRRRLAYPIKKLEDGVYTRFLYDSGIEVPKELERRMRLSDNVIRVLTVRLERDWAKDAKEQAVRDAKERAEAKAAAEAAAAAAAEEEARKAAEAEAAAEESPAEEPETESPAETAEPTSAEKQVEPVEETATDAPADEEEKA